MGCTLFFGAPVQHELSLKKCVCIARVLLLTYSIGLELEDRLKIDVPVAIAIRQWCAEGTAER
jgi:hypothetical protein